MGKLDRDSRYSGVYPTYKMAKHRAVVVGCGAVGRNLAIQLVASGLPSIHLVDMDTGSEENLGPQGWNECDVGEPKVVALEETLTDLNADLDITMSTTVYVKNDITDEVASLVFICVDDMDVRKQVVEDCLKHFGEPVQFVCEARMGAEQFTVHPMSSKEHLQEWLDTLYFPQDEAEPLPCTAKATTYIATACAAQMLHEYTRWLRDWQVPKAVRMFMSARNLEVEGRESKEATPEVVAEETT